MRTNSCRRGSDAFSSRLSVAVVMAMSLAWLLPLAEAFSFQPGAPNPVLKNKMAASPLPSPMTMTTPTRSSRVLFTAKDRHAYHSAAALASGMDRAAAVTSPLQSRGSRSGQSLLFASSSTSPSSPGDKTLAQKIWKAISYPIREWVLKPIRWLFRRLFVKKKKTLKQDFHDKLEMLTDEQVVNGDTSSLSSSPPPAAVASTTVDMVDDISADQQEEEAPVTTTAVKEAPVATGKKWAVAASNVNLTGHWTMIVSEEFKKQYDEYLKKLGQPLLVRSVALSIVGMTTEETVQDNNGRELLIRGRNARGVWERTLVTSMSKKDQKNFEPITTKITTADAETVEAEAWWENSGKVHKSWLRGGTKYGGGDFESSRFLEDNGNVLVCESVFHPKDPTREQARVTWKFRRDDRK